MVGKLLDEHIESENIFKPQICDHMCWKIIYYYPYGQSAVFKSYLFAASNNSQYCKSWIYKSF